MSLSNVHDLTVLEYKQRWFLWEPAWETFRPITALAWTGTEYDLDDRAYCSDPMDPLYGFGSPQMKALCDGLTQMFASQVAKAPTRTMVSIGSSEWFYDRMASLTPCAPRDRASWKRMTHGRYKTLRRAPRNKLTRRTL